MREGLPGLLCAIAFFAGTCAGLSMPADADAWVDAALIGAFVLATMAWLLRRDACVASLGVLVSVALLGIVSGGVETTARHPEAPIGLVDPEPTLVRYEARLEERFHAPDLAKSDLLDGFQPDADQPPWSAQAQLLALHGAQGRLPVQGRVTISAPTGPHALEPGDRIEGVGWLAGPSEPVNPGERDARLASWRSHWMGRLRTDSIPTCVERAGTARRILEAMRSFADRSLETALDGWCDDDTRALVVAMTTGRRLPGYAGLRRTFSATGLSHFLAISGFNVAVLFVTCGVTMEWLRVPGASRGCMLMVIAALFLMVVDVEVSVLRAGLAGLLSGASISLGRSWRSDGLLATAAMATLVADPHAAWNAGFQLSYLAVLALRHGSTPLEAWLRAPFGGVARNLPGPLVRMVRGGGVALAASAAASIVSTPITLAWFGNLHPWCAVASTLLGPVAAALTVSATIVVVLGQVPWLGPTLGLPLAALAGAFRLGVHWVGAWPGCSLALEALPWWWAVTAIACTFAWWTLRPGRARRAAVACTAAVWSAGMLAATRPVESGTAATPGAFHWTSIAVGDGSAHVLEAGGVTVLFDAGSISRAGAGSATVVPTLRSIGVSRIDVLVVSHPHLDHFSAIPEVLDAFPVRRVLLTEAWLRDARPATATGTLLACVRGHGIEPEALCEGASLRQGPVTWRCLHPPRGFRPTAVNDGSAALLLTHEELHDRPLALLLGDAQDQSIARLLARRDLLRPVVMELPHHGGWRPMAQALCEWVRPSFVMQSTGVRRFRRDRFEPCLRDAVRGATCRDGALRFSLDPANPPAKLERWSERGWVPLRPP